MDRALPVSPWSEWQIVEKIGEGAYGRVYKARRTEHGHSFYSAIKIISIPSAREEWNSVLAETKDERAARAYFENIMEECIQEICTMENFHGNSYIVSVEDFKVVEYLDEVGWDIYIRMEYLTSFLEYCAGRNFGEKEVLRLGIDLCRALSYCKKQNIIHRDIKPENIFVSRFGDFKLGDFGTAREIQKVTGSFSKKGTYSYMAPELYKGEPYDDGADIYALGLMLYKLLNHNRLPFLSLEKQLITYRDKEQALNQRMSGAELPAPAEASPEFAAILSKACAYRREDRYSTAVDFLRDLEQLRSARRRKNSTPKKESREEQEQRIRRAGVLQAQEKRKARMSRKKKEDETARNVALGTQLIRNAAPWIIAIIVVATAAVIITGVFMKQMLSNTVAQQNQEMVSQIQDKSAAGIEDSGADFAESIEVISDRVTTIVDEITEYREEGTAEQLLRYYGSDGDLRKVLVYPNSSAENVYEEYYYWNSSLIFAYIWKGEDVDMYYYRDGILIRWIDRENKIHDNETEDDTYLMNGDRYWNNSLMYLED